MAATWWRDLGVLGGVTPSGGKPLGEISSTGAELQGACEAVYFAFAFIEGRLCADYLVI